MPTPWAKCFRYVGSFQLHLAASPLVTRLGPLRNILSDFQSRKEATRRDQRSSFVQVFSLEFRVAFGDQVDQMFFSPDKNQNLKKKKSLLNKKRKRKRQCLK